MRDLELRKQMDAFGRQPTKPADPPTIKNVNKYKNR